MQEQWESIEGFTAAGDVTCALKSSFWPLVMEGGSPGRFEHLGRVVEPEERTEREQEEGRQTLGRTEQMQFARRKSTLR